MTPSRATGKRRRSGVVLPLALAVLVCLLAGVVSAFAAGVTVSSARLTSVSKTTPAFSTRTFVFKSTTASTGGLNCESANRARDMAEGFTPTDPEETFVRGGTDWTINFCSPTFSILQTLSAGTTTVTAYFHNANLSSACAVTATLYQNGVLLTSLGSGTVSIPANTPTTVRTWSFSTTGATFAVGEQLNLSLRWGNTAACNDAYLHYDGASTNSRVIVPAIS